MKDTTEQIIAKLNHGDKVLQLFENNKHWITPSHDNVVDMYRVTLRVWRKLRAIHEKKDNTQEQEIDIYAAEKAEIERIEFEIKHIHVLLRFLRYSSYPIYTPHPNLILLESALKERHKKLKALQIQMQHIISELFSHKPVNTYAGYNEQDELVIFDTKEEADKAYRKRRIRNLKLTVVKD